MPITDLEVGPDGNIYLTTGGARGSGRPVQSELDGREACAAGHDRHPRRRPSAAAALELGLGGDREGEGVDGCGVRRGAREAGAERQRPRRRIARARSSKCSATARRRAPRCSSALLKDRSANVRAAAVYVAGLQTSDAREGGRRGGAQGCEPARAAARRRGARAPGADRRQRPSFAPVAGHLRAAAGVPIASSATPGGSRSSTRRAASGSNW